MGHARSFRKKSGKKKNGFVSHMSNLIATKVIEKYF